MAKGCDPLAGGDGQAFEQRSLSGYASGGHFAEDKSPLRFRQNKDGTKLVSQAATRALDKVGQVRSTKVAFGSLNSPKDKP